MNNPICLPNGFFIEDQSKAIIVHNNMKWMSQSVACPTGDGVADHLGYGLAL